MAMIPKSTANETVVRHPVTGMLHTAPAELIEQMRNRIVILQQQTHSLARFSLNKDGRQQPHLLQQQIRTLYRQIYLLEQQHSRVGQHDDNDADMTLSVRPHAAHGYQRKTSPSD